MKKLNMIKPDVNSGFLNFGKGQEVTYLNIDSDMNLSKLKKDVENGAVQFEKLSEFASKKPSQFVVINCDNEEEGFMAVSYLQSVYNQVEKVKYYDDEDNEISEMMDIEFEDFEEDGFFASDDDDWEESTKWEETPWKIPIVDLVAIANDSTPGFSPFYAGTRGMRMMDVPRMNLPFWYYTRTESICIVMKEQAMFITGGNNVPVHFKRYKNNKHVYVVVVRNNTEVIFNDNTTANLTDQAVCELSLEYAAGVIDIKANEHDKKQYYATLFENWVSSLGYKLAKRFRVSRIVDGIVAINNPNKSELMGKVIKYVIKDERDNNELNEKDFNVLEKFKLLGAEFGTNDSKSAKKLADEIVGLDAVKDQINGIVQMMKFNKMRKEKGLSTSGFHNVHMLLGAPGTAKTTVAELLGRMMSEQKLISGNRFISVNGAELKGMYVGHSAPKVKALFDDYDIILIDEAYAVASGHDGDNDSFSQEAIAQLIVELEKHGMDHLVLFAGYGGKNVTSKDNKMKAFLDANPGIRSRINSTIYFDSYTPDQMVDIFNCHARLANYTVEKGSDAVIKEFFTKRVSRHDFGNGREARSLLENTIVQVAMRLSSHADKDITEKEMCEIKVEDIRRAIDKMQFGMDMQLGCGSGRVGFAC